MDDFILFFFFIFYYFIAVKLFEKIGYWCLKLILVFLCKLLAALLLLVGGNEHVNHLACLLELVVLFRGAQQWILDVIDNIFIVCQQTVFENYRVVLLQLRDHHCCLILVKLWIVLISLLGRVTETFEERLLCVQSLTDLLLQFLCLVIQISYPYILNLAPLQMLNTFHGIPTMHCLAFTHYLLVLTVADQVVYFVAQQVLPLPEILLCWLDLVFLLDLLWFCFRVYIILTSYTYILGAAHTLLEQLQLLGLFQLIIDLFLNFLLNIFARWRYVVQMRRYII